MPDSILSLLTQLPIVAVFIWYTERLYGKFEKFLTEERSARLADRADERESRHAYEKEMMTLITSLNEQLRDHDERLALAMTRMDERYKQTSKTTNRRTPQ